MGVKIATKYGEVADVPVLFHEIVTERAQDTFYRYQELAEKGDINALVNQNRGVPNLKRRL